MTTLSKRRRLNDLKDRETRQIFYSEHNLNALPIQIRELRKKRRFTQKELADLAGTDQGYISKLEDPNFTYAPQIGTLERLANAFDVPLIVRFGSWEELWDWENNLTPERLAPKNFEDSLPSLEATLERDNIATNNQTRGSFRVILGKRKAPAMFGESSQRRFNFHIRGLATNRTLSYPRQNIRPRLFEGESTAALRRAK